MPSVPRQTHSSCPTSAASSRTWRSLARRRRPQGRHSSTRSAPIFDALLNLGLDAGDNGAAAAAERVAAGSTAAADIVQEFHARFEALARERALTAPINELAERVTTAILERVRRH
jgi:hypothetical protein